MDFPDTTVLITGATSGIGQATAERFARLGAHVIVSGRDTGRGEQTVAGITQAGGTARFIAADLSTSSDTLRLAEEAGEVDILVNNAGGSPFAPLSALTEAQIRNVLEVNLIAPMLLVKQLAPGMVERGRGAIVSISSFASAHGIPALPVYGAAKAGIDTLTRTWGIEYGPAGIRVNAVSPGSVRTPPAEVMGDMFDQMAGNTPLGRAATADEIARVITYLASDDASYITGTTIAADAGMSAG